MSIILLLTYILRYSHREAMSQSFKRKRVLANQRSQRYFSYVKKNDTSNQNRVRWFFTYEKNDMSNQRPQWCVSFAPKFLPFIGAWSLQRPLFWSCLTDIQREKFFSKGIVKETGYKSRKHRRLKQRWCNLCWKLPDRAQPFVFCSQIVTE